MKFLGNAVIFVMVYLLFMVPTYILPYMGSNSAVINAASLTVIEEIGPNPALIIHFLCLLVLIVFTYFRGILINKNWLLIFPILATFFDLMPGFSLVPMVPTVMHLLAIILGVVGTQVALGSVQEQKEI